MRTSWRKPALLGLAFVALLAAILIPWVMWETRNQERSFEVALRAVDTERFVAPTERRGQTLRSERGQYHWSLLVWERVADEWHPSLFHVHVDRRADFLVRDTRLEPFPEAQARGHRPPG